MSPTHGFDLVRNHEIPELNSEALLYRHAKTGAELLSLINDEENKVFGVTFRTPPRDSTGIPHILEHSVLCGSRKYPVKEPFVQLIKGSLKTFLNAMTYPDKTCYPVASQNLQDFYNLIDVYLDAVFYPRLTLHTLQQEGWHYELEALEAPLTYNGVVFNEMKGSYSSPDAALSRASQHSLYPDIAYRNEAGGDPRHIPDLTYAEFRSFHSRLYHPTNARLFFYGNDDPEERLRLLGSWLNAFDLLKVDSRIPLQPRFTQPRRLSHHFMASDSRLAHSAMVTVNWMLDPPSDSQSGIGRLILEEILIGTPASPLRKALLDSGLGEAIAGDGLRDDLRQPMFSIGLKGIDAGNAEKIEALIIDVLRELAERGIDRAALEAALNTVEFHLRENNFGSFPRGIVLMLRALKLWLHERDPVSSLTFETPLRLIKMRAQPERYFEGLIASELLNNSHRTAVLLLPDPKQAEREAADERARLEAVRRAMSRTDLISTVELTRSLKRLQETPDPPEALATIPMLGLNDLPHHQQVIPIEATTVGPTRVLYHELPTNGVVYLDVGFDLHALKPALLPLTALFGRALLETGTGEQDFVTLSQRIGRSTGGIRSRSWTSAIFGAQTGSAWLFLRAKTVPEKIGQLCELLRDVLLTARLDNRDRIAQLVLEEKSREESRLVPGGASLVSLRLRAHFHEADWANEQINGISYLFFLRELAEALKTDRAAAEEALNEVRGALINRDNMLCNVTCDAAARRQLEPELFSLLEALSAGPSPFTRWRVPPCRSSEGLAVPAKVNFVAKGAKLQDLGYLPNGATQVVRKYLNTTWLWEKIRVQGGAYGGICAVDRRSGGFTLLSYRDPNLLETLKVFDSTCQFLAQVDLSHTELTRSIIGAIGEIDAYQLPDAKGFTSLRRYIVGDTEATVQRLREEVLATSIADFRELAGALAGFAEVGRIVVLGSHEAIQQANAERGTFLDELKVL